MAVELITIPCRADNYAWLLSDSASGLAALVDVPDAAPVLEALEASGWTLDYIWLTHHHDDHIAGVAEVVAATGAKVWGAAADAHRLPPLDLALTEGAAPDFGAQAVQVFDVPGHTVGHIAYYLPGAGMAFTGDSLMSWGCGRLFEGTPAQMFGSLAKFAALPPETVICSGHEYTLSNGRFALSLEPDHPDLLARMAAAEMARAQGHPTLPVDLATELATNPFLRGSDPALARALGLAEGADALAVFTAARAAKDRF
ncbi:MAG: hydroxyacylglutathione hydrolase [Sphingomonadales bacterium]|nr:hydroxyacylglutathione hydrolase [Sphingomonadales bacterium]